MGRRSRHWRLGIVGFGHVGRAFVDLLDEAGDELVARRGITVALGLVATSRATWVAVDEAPPGGGLQPRDGVLEGGRLGPPNVAEAIADAPIDALVELTPWRYSTSEPGLGHLRAALASGLHAITANKAPVAVNGPELRAQASASRLGFRYEAAVMDCLPITRLRSVASPIGPVDEFAAVANSTTNFVLDSMADGVPKEEAIREAQQLGVAEADVTLDLDGWDAAYKAAILGHELLDLAVRPSDIAREGIGAVTDADARRATSESCRYRLVARGSRPHGLVSVAPERVPIGSSFGVVRGLSMSVALRSRYAGQLEVSLVGPSLTQTAYALAMDLVELNAAVEGGHLRPPRGSFESVHPVGPGWS